MKKYIISSLVALALVMNVGTPARAEGNVTIAELQAQINQLMTLLQKLTAQQGTTNTTVPATSTVVPGVLQCLTYSRDLNVGFSGDDVKTLQQILSNKGFLNIPESNGKPTGYFGSLTREALKKWQISQGLIASGKFDPDTRNKMNGVSGCGTPPVTPPAITFLYPKGGEIFGVNDKIDVAYWVNNLSEKTTLYLYSPIYGNVYSEKIDAKGTGKGLTTINPSQQASSYKYGTYKVGICDEANVNPNVTFKPLCVWSNEFTVASVASIPSTRSIKVLSPNGGETIPYGDIVMAGDLNFKWTSSQVPSSSFKAYIVNSEGTIIRDDKSNSISSIGNNTYISSFVGESKITLGTNYKIKVCDVILGNTVCDTSDNYFMVVNHATLVTPNITSLSKAGVKTGESVTITGTNFKTNEDNHIFIENKNGGVWQVEGRAVGAGERQTLTFTVGDWNTDQYNVYVVNSAGTSNSVQLYIYRVATNYTVVGAPSSSTGTMTEIPFNSQLKKTTITLSSGANVNFYEGYGDGAIPEVGSLDYISAKSGTVVTITGKNFKTNEDNKIFIDNFKGGVWQMSARAINSGGSAQFLKFTVGDWDSGTYYVYVTNSNGQSNYRGIKIVK